MSFITIMLVLFLVTVVGSRCIVFSSTRWKQAPTMKAKYFVLYNWQIAIVRVVGENTAQRHAKIPSQNEDQQRH